MPFWNHYIGIESTVSAHNMLNEVNNCLYDLNVFLAINKINLEKILLLTPQRTKKYSVIDNMLKSEGVKDADRKVTLDGHDFACNSPDPIDFVTFDEECYTGAKNVKILCFNNIKGKYDF